MITAKLTIAQPIRVNASGISTRGARGKSTYELYLETTTDNPPMTEEEFVNSKAVLEQTTGQSTTHGMSQKAVTDELALKVDKVTGKSLISDAEITRLASVTNQTLFGLGGEPAVNKKTTINPASDIEFPTSKAVATALALKTDDSTLQASLKAAYPVIPYRSRVLSDSGVISDLDKLTKLYIENLKLLDNTVLMWDGSAGLKTRTSGVNQYATKLYDMSAGNRDAVQATEANQPHTSGYIAPNEQRKLKGLTGETGTKGVTGSDIQIASSGAFTLAIAVKWNYPRTSSRIYLSATNYIELTASTITLKGDSGNVLTCAHAFRAGLTEILTFEYNNGAGLIRVNGVEKTTTATSGAVTFGSLFLNQTSYNFDGEISKLQIANIRLSASQIQNVYNFTRLQHPEIEGIAIGNQFWATSNYEGVVTGNGTVIPEVQDANNVDRITNGIFAGGLAPWSVNNANVYWQSGSGDGEVVLNGTGTANALIQTGLASIPSGVWVLLKYKVVSNTLNAGALVTGAFSANEVILNPIILTSTVGSHVKAIQATKSGTALYLYVTNTSTSGSIVIDDVSFETVGWSQSDILYNAIISQGGTQIAALNAAAMWCYYNNNPLLGAAYGKEYNGYGKDAIAANPPAGWRVPTLADFIQLANYLGGTAVAGGKLKKEGLTYWNSPNTGATNESGFSAIGAGYRTIAGEFADLSYSCRMWSSTSNRLGIGYNSLGITTDSVAPGYGYHIRLIRNEPVGATERNVETGYITNALGATNLDISIPFGYQVESIRFDSETNITGLSAKLYTGALTELETLFTAKSVTANVQKVIAADADQSIQQTDAVVRINGTKANTASRFRVWVKITKVVFS